jgi:type 1 glutamine amidotransferase
MKKIGLVIGLCLVLSVVAYRPLLSAKASTPRRLLLVTATIGFRHAAVPIEEQVLRQMAKDTGEFTIVSTSDSPDFPSAAYQVAVDERNARIPVRQARPNDLPPIGGEFGGPGAKPEQEKVLTEMDNSIAPFRSAVNSATSALNSAIRSGNSDATVIKTSVDAEIAAELAFGEARSKEFKKIQASPANLNADQVQALAQSTIGWGGSLGMGGGRGPQGTASRPLTDAQRSAIAAMNESLATQNQAVAAARAAFNSAIYAQGQSQSVLKANADTLEAAQLAYSVAAAAALSKIQASPDRLTSDQAALISPVVILKGGPTFAAPTGGRGGRGGPNAPDPIRDAVTKVLQQYLSPEKLKDYDAVAFCSTTGELPIPDKDAFFQWIADGHGFIGLHSATDTLHNTPEYIKMLGAEFAGHDNFHPKVEVDNMDPKNPINAGWGQSIAINEEFYLFKNYDPKQVHLLLAMPIQPYAKQPGTYPVSWIKMYGKGRVYYTSLGHRDDVLLPNPTVGDQEYKVRFNQAPVALAVQKQILNGVRWALGLIDADARPQARSSH